MPFAATIPGEDPRMDWWQSYVQSTNQRAAQLHSIMSSPRSSRRAGMASPRGEKPLPPHLTRQSHDPPLYEWPAVPGTKGHPAYPKKGERFQVSDLAIWERRGGYRPLKSFPSRQPYSLPPLLDHAKKPPPGVTFDQKVAALARDFQRLDHERDSMLSRDDIQRSMWAFEVHFDPVTLKRMLDENTDRMGLVNYRNVLTAIRLGGEYTGPKEFVSPLRPGVTEKMLRQAQTMIVEAMERKNPSLHVHCFAAMFKQIDTDNSGMLERSEIDELVRSLGIQDVLSGAVLDNLIDFMDPDINAAPGRDCKITFREFARVLGATDVMSMAPQRMKGGP